MRKLININSNWEFAKDNVNFENINLPHTWNNFDGQDGGADYYRGTCTYRKSLANVEHALDEVVYLEFEGAHSICDVYLNGEKITHHEGGFSTFRVRIDELLKDENELVVTVDNSENDRVYPQFADFTFYGGIYRNVNIIVTNKVHFDLDYLGAPGVKVTPVVEGANAKVEVESYVTNYTNEEIRLTVLSQEGEVVYANTSSQLVSEFVLENVHLWDGIKDPYLYTLNVEILSNGLVLDNKEIKFGCRSFRIDPQEGFFLNGRSYPLRGVSRHQDRLDMGWAITKAEHEEDMELIAEVGANTIRLAHYQHDQHFYDLCDKYGMVVWAEIPYISRHLFNGHENAVSQMKELIAQNYNHPSIVVWGLSNEITMQGEEPDCIKRHKELNELVHSMDKTRLTTMAQVSPLPMDSEMNRISDVISYNHYFGWYGGHYNDNEEWIDKFHALYPNTCLGISEYGCECILKWHTSNGKSGDYTEEYQAEYHTHMLEVFESRQFLWATHVWNMFDFAADARDEGGCQGRNNKGLVTYDRKTKKDSFYLYQAYWTEKPMLHLASKRYVYRNEEVTKVIAYSNNPEVSLYINGQLVQTLNAHKVFKFEVALQMGENNIRVESNGLVDEALIVRVEEEHKEYSFVGSGAGVVNWFDKDGKKLDFTYNEGYYSVQDNMGELFAHPEAAKVVQEFLGFMAKAMMGDMTPEQAAKTMGGEGAMKMMMGFSIERLGKLLGNKLPAEVVQAYNVKLQQIKKPE